MKYKMLVLDVDDTLLTDDHKISAKNKELLLKAQDLGVCLVLASGRPTPAMMGFAEELKLKSYGSYMLSYNGGVITDMSNSRTRSFKGHPRSKPAALPAIRVRGSTAGLLICLNIQTLGFSGIRQKPFPGADSYRG